MSKVYYVVSKNNQTEFIKSCNYQSLKTYANYPDLWWTSNISEAAHLSLRPAFFRASYDKNAEVLKVTETINGYYIEKITKDNQEVKREFSNEKFIDF